MRFSGVLSRYSVHLQWFVLALACCACGRTTTTDFVGPSGSRCDVAVANNNAEIPASGGNGSLAVTVPRDCTWSAATEAPWITLSTSAGQGPATLAYSVLPNPSGTPRRGRVVISEQRVDIAQAAAPCRYEVSQSTLTLDAAQQDVSIALTTPEGCPWSTRTDASWIYNFVPPEGVGSGNVRFTVDANRAPDERTGTVAIGEATVRLHQATVAGPDSPPATCSYEVSPARITANAAGEQVAIRVTAHAGCPWTASSSTPWIAIASGASGAGNGSIDVVIAPNTGNARSGTVTVAGRTTTIEQRAAAAPTCTYGIRPTSYNAGRGPDDITINVTADSGCAWTATTNAAWVSVDAGRTGSGSGTVRLLVQPNSGAPRTATVLIAGQTFTLHQEGAACTTAIRPGSYHSGRGPDDIRIEVTADAGCTWSAASTVSWVTVAEGATGSGNGVVRLLVQPNSGPARAVTLTIAGQPFALRQNGAP